MKLHGDSILTPLLTLTVVFLLLEININTYSVAGVELSVVKSQESPITGNGIIENPGEIQGFSNTWTYLDPFPAARHETAIAYDTESNRLILFGGSINSYAYLETWAYDYQSNTWTNMNPLVHPTRGGTINMIYDSKIDRIIFNTGGTQTNPSETWSYDYNSNIWTNLYPQSPILFDRLYATMVYDSLNDRIILFGGCWDIFCNTILDETWMYDYYANTWIRLNPVIRPPQTYHASMVYDLHSNRIITWNGMSVRKETWVFDYDNNTWINMNPAVSPAPPNWAFPAIYDIQSDRMILFVSWNTGGFQTWTYDYYANNWTNMNPNIIPSIRRGIALSSAYMIQGDKSIFFGGCTLYDSSTCTLYSNDVWTYDFHANNWTLTVPSSTHPSARAAHAMAFDEQSNRVILFGGSSNIGFSNETWVFDYDNSTWINMNPSKVPSPRNGYKMVYSSQCDRIFLFGGYDGNNYLNDTWTYDFDNNTWVQMIPTISPSTRSEYAMAYDLKSDRIILFGGRKQNNIFLNDTWAYDFNVNTWTDMKTNVYIDRRSTHAMAYNSRSDRIILVGGVGQNGQEFDDVWSYDYDGNKWTRMGFMSLLYADNEMIYDSESDALIVFGGYYSYYTYAYNYELNTWTNMEPSPYPPLRGGFGMVYDPHSDYVIIFSGMERNNNLNDTWAYQLIGSTPCPSILSTNPMNKAINIPPTTDIAIEFSDLMNQSASENAISAIPLITGSFKWDGTGKIVTWDPNLNLSFRTTYIITILNSAKNISGSYLKNPYIFSFTTTPPPDIYPPYIVQTYPKDGDTNVSNNTGIDITWNETMDKGSAENAFSSSPNIICTWSWTGLNQTCTPTMPLQYNIAYVITISTAAKDIVGNSMKNPHSFSFTTEKGQSPKSPKVLFTTPSNGSTNISTTTNIIISFDKSMSRTVTEAAVSSSPVVSWTVGWSSNDYILTLTPTSSLQPSTKYIMTVTTTAASTDGVNLASDYVFSFTTVPVTNNTPPNVVSTVPYNGQKDVDISSQIVITFNKPMDQTSTYGSVSITPGSITDKKWDTDGKVLTITVPLSEETLYTVTISTDAKDALGNTMQVEYKFTFTTKKIGQTPGSNAGFDIITVLVIILIATVVVIMVIILFLFMRKKKRMENQLSTEKREKSQEQ